MALDGSAEVSDSTILTPKPDSVRLAGPEDEERVYKFLTLLHAENGMGKLSPDRSWAIIHKGTRKEGGIIGVIEKDGQIVASIGLALSQWWYSDDWHVEELWSFVHPDHRTDHHFEDLLQFAKWVADSMSLPALLGILTVARAEAKTRLYRKYLPQVGALFLYVPPTKD